MAVTIVGIIFAAIGVLGVFTVLNLKGSSQAMAVITALTSAGGTIVGAPTGASTGASGFGEEGGKGYHQGRTDGGGT